MLEDVKKNKTSTRQKHVQTVIKRSIFIQQVK